tara:strand:+ start:2737 stop:3159 length:423 start_codon:yes stop_codon:yes gene_type:complete
MTLLRKTILVALFSMLIATGFLSAPSYAADTNDTDIIMLEDEGDIEDAKELNEVVDVLSDEVGVCMGEGSTNETCMCDNIDLLYDFQDAFDRAVDYHPVWIGRNVYYKNEKEGGTAEGVTLNFVGLQTQYEMIENLDCNE